jgi:D-3-phosphoglycerate dehydrogenase
MKILMADAFDPSLPSRLALFGEVFTDTGRLAEADVLLVRSKTKVTRELLAGAPELKLVIRGGVGLDSIDVEACRERGILVRNTPRASSVAVAELALALMLAAANRVVEGHVSTREGRWLKKDFKRTELHGKTLGLLGAGLIGTEVARRALAFGMRVIAYDPNLPNHALAELVDADDELFSRSDFISIHLPLTPETKGLIDTNAISRMKTGAILVNTARGKVIVEKDVAAALAEGKLGCYATDVYESDPPSPDSPLLKAPNVLLMPHVGGSSPENLLRIGDLVFELLSKWARTASRADLVGV